MRRVSRLEEKELRGIIIRTAELEQRQSNRETWQEQHACGLSPQINSYPKFPSAALSLLTRALEDLLAEQASQAVDSKEGIA